LLFGYALKIINCGKKLELVTTDAEAINNMAVIAVP